MSLYDVYVRDILELQPVLDDMVAEGLPVDEGRRAEYAYALQEKITALVEQMRAIVPRECLPDDILSKPRSMEGLEEITVDVFVPICPGCGLIKPLKPHFKVFKKKVNECGGLIPTAAIRPQIRWRRRNEFVPSLTQILRYQQFKNHKPVLRRDKKTGQMRPTSDEAAIRTLILRYKEDSLYSLILDFRGLDKLAGTYIGRPDPTGIIGGLPTDAKGCVHTILSHNPSTGRLSASRLHQIPRPSSPEAAMVKKMFVAPEGMTFWGVDYSGIEAVLVGYFAGSPRYTRLAKIDVHSFFTAYALYELEKMITFADLPDLSWSDDDLRACLSNFKKRFKAKRQLNKHLVHGGNYLMTAIKAQEVILNEEGIVVPVKQLRALYDVYFGLFPEVQTWQMALCNRVDGTRRTATPGIEAGTCYIRSPWGWVHRFYQPLRWESTMMPDGSKRWDASLGEDAKRVVAYLPQHSAAQTIKAAGKRLYYEHWERVGRWMRLWIHDEIMGLCPIGLGEAVLAGAREEMEKPIPELPLDPAWGMGEFLTIGTEAKLGRCWGEMQEVTL